MITKTSSFIVVLALASPISAADIGKLRSKPVDLVLESSKHIFEVERCLIESDGPGVPSVYRQPDRPDFTMIAYSQGIGVPLLVELSKTNTGTRIDIRTPRLPVRKANIPSHFRTCL